MEGEMRLIIYGAGGIGCVMGGHLYLKGQEVVLIGRPGHVNAINEKGLKFITPMGTHMLSIPAVTGPEQIEFGPDDAVCLTMKGQNTEGAMKDLKAVVDDIPVFCFQNGVRNEEIVSGYFPRVYGAMVRVGSVYLEDGEIIARRDPPGWFIIGRYPTGKDEVAEKVAEHLRTASFYVRTSEDAMPYKWGKLLGNLGNAIGAITNARWGEMGHVMQAAQKELTDLLAEADIHWISQEQVSQEWPEISEPLRGSISSEAQSSTWQSLAREQGTVETDFLNGEVVRLAGRLGKQAPINETLMRISKEMAANREHPGKYTADQLSSLLGLDSPS
jgi:2-dehydropantoate 2-reductase